MTFEIAYAESLPFELRRTSEKVRNAYLGTLASALREAPGKPDPPRIKRRQALCVRRMDMDLRRSVMVRSRNPLHRPACWAFFANPSVYRIDEAVRDLETDTWTTKGKPIAKGDRAMIWRGASKKSPRGVVALALVLTDPEPLSDVGNPYWIQAPATTEERVRVRYFVPSALPLCLTGGVDSLLSSLSVSRARGGTVFHVTDDQWDGITAALGGDPTTPSVSGPPTRSP